MIGAFAAAKRALHRRGILGSGALPRPVISVGNLAAGGTGKTPHVQFLARFLSGKGLAVAILSRGYGRTMGGVLWVSRGGGPVVTADEGGDEPFLLAGTLPGVAVLVGESRLAAGRECLEAGKADVFLLDDGYQHFALRRDLDILLVDGERGLGNRLTLPFGPLREPPRSARFADALVITKCADAPAGRRVAATVPFPPGRTIAVSRMVPSCLADRRGRESAIPPGLEVAAFGGIARNRQFEETLRAAGLRVRRFLSFPDHRRYTAGDIERIAAAADGLPVLTTEKDLVRLPESAPFPVMALRVTVEFIDGWDGLSGLILSRIGQAA
ncbi:MAG: tetraacyldisaccharide 4'-kinase [Deltaproteobacteria bacterium]|nr:tetraacyldisaccharide 4'-kinase [Deltaproteobacteria bacterium]